MRQVMGELIERVDSLQQTVKRLEQALSGILASCNTVEFFFFS